LSLRAHNWIDGRLVEAESGAWFELASAEGTASLGRWPRSSGLDWRVALDSARGAQPGWTALGAAARQDLLRAAARHFLDAPDPDGTSQHALGFSDAELARHLVGLDAAVADGLSPVGALGTKLARGPLGARDGPCCLAPTWSSGWHAPARAVLFALRTGRTLIFLPDGRLPGVGDALREALHDLPRGVFQLVHDDARTTVRAACEEPDLSTAIVSAERLGANEAAPAHVALVRAQRTSFVIDPARELGAQVERVLDAWIGRARALSGSRSGQIGRVLAPERVFSRVSELVLAHLAASADAARPLPLALRAQADQLEAAAALGLDEGATAISAGIAGGSADFPVVLTNVEPPMRVARHSEPCGLLLLLRARDVRSAHAAAARLDQEVRS
jgi:acyl-CoA reductase-like NAD-dependent aldehyde dehydrogenase